MCKYEMDPMSIVEDTERTRFCPQTDKVIPVYPPFNFVEAEGIIKNSKGPSMDLCGTPQFIGFILDGVEL